MNANMHITVAVVVESAGQFLMVEERVGGAIMLNQPARHLEPGESLIEAAIRETLEETARSFEPEGLLGIYHANQPDSTWLRFAFVGRVGEPDRSRALEEGVVEARFMSLDEIRARQSAHRSPFVMACVHDYLAGHRLPLSTLKYFDLRGKS